MWRRSVLVACCLFAAAAVLHAASHAGPPLPRERLDRLPEMIDGWLGHATPPLDASVVTMLGTDDLVNRIYTRPARSPVALYVGYYATQREGDTIHSPLNCLPGAGWEPVGRARAPVAVRRAPNGPVTLINVNRLVIAKGPDRALVLYWYQSHGRVTASEYWGRALLVLDALRTSRTDGALVRVIAPIASSSEEDEAASARAATSFVQALFPLLGRFLPD